MADGIRIRHTTLRVECIVAVRDLTERLVNTDGSALPTGYMYPGCSVCGLASPGHEGYKTRHVEIDADGYGIVSEGVLEGLKKLADLGGFDISNVVKNPPAVTLTMLGDGQVRRKLIHKYPLEVNTKGSTHGDRST